MKYLIMECHFSYAVALDENGMFVKVANRNYQVGQTVTDVILMRTSEQIAAAENLGNSDGRASKTRKKRTWISACAAAAACLAVLVTSSFYISQMQYASVYMAINPEVRIDVNRNDKVVKVEGVNLDGERILQDYRYRRKDLNLVMDELVDRAMDMGYLHEGGQVTLTLDADDGEWVTRHQDALADHLDGYLEEKIRVTIEVTEWGAGEEKIEVPAMAEPAYQEADYGETKPQTEAAVSENKPDQEDEVKQPESEADASDEQEALSAPVIREPDHHQKLSGAGESDYEEEMSEEADESDYEEDD